MPPPIFYGRACRCPSAIPLAFAVCLQTVSGVPTGTNLGFENNLSGWTTSGTSIETSKTYAGSKSLALKGGFIQQTFTGLQAGAVHTLSLAYQDNTPEKWILSHARLLIDGRVIGEIHNGQDFDFEYLHAGGFEFVPGASSATLRIESLDPGPGGFLIDEIAIVAGGLPAPPQHPWNTLAPVGDTRGGRLLANGGFESPTSNPATDPNNAGPVGNPHLAGVSLPGWLVTRENVDLLEGGAADPPEGSNALDTGGHGPGGISQTITGLQPGAVYTLSFMHARHIYWGEQDMTGEVLANGHRVAGVVRTIHQTWEDGYELAEIPVLASSGGVLTVEIRSTVTDQGGNILYDDIRLRQGGDGFSAWTRHHGIPADRDADQDRDGMPAGLEFLFGTDPLARDGLPPMTSGPSGRMLRVPVSGLARSAGFSHSLRCSRDLVHWKAFAEGGSGAILVSDSSAAGVNGERIFRIANSEPRMFWTHGFTGP